MLTLLALTLAAAASVVVAIAARALPWLRRETLFSLAAVGEVGGIAIFAVGGLLALCGTDAGVPIIQTAYVVMTTVALAYPAARAVDRLLGLLLGPSPLARN